MTTPTIICLNSPAPEHGKTTVAKYIATMWGFKHMSFADPLRAIIHTLYRQAGISTPMIKYYMHNKEGKETLIPEFGKTYRYMIRTLGTEWGRDMIDENMWTNILVNRVRRAKANPNTKFIVDDTRFKSEWNTTRYNFNAELWEVRNENLEIVHTEHRSEGELHTTPKNVLIKNNGTLVDLYNTIHIEMDKFLNIGNL
jgi:hypothetical protein